jgi:hypothetical protein
VNDVACDVQPDTERRICSELERVYPHARNDGRLPQSVAKAISRYPDIGSDAELRGSIVSWVEHLEARALEAKTWREALRDLQTRLYYIKPRRRLTRELAGWATQHAVRYVVVISVVAAGLLRIAYGHFYQPLGVYPEEAGLSSTVLLARSLPGTLCLVLAVSVAIALLLLPVTAIADATQERRRGLGGSQDMFGVVVFLIVFGIGVSLAIWVAFFLQARPYPRTISHSYSDIVYIGIGLLAFVPLAGPALTLPELASNFHKGLRPVVIFKRSSVESTALFASIMATAVVLCYLPIVAAQRADDVRKGVPVGPVGFAGLPLLGIKAEAVRVYGAEVGKCVLYLGMANNIAIVFRPSDSHIVRIPMDAIRIETGNGKECATGPRKVP